MSDVQHTPRWAVCEAGEGRWAVLDCRPPGGQPAPLAVRSDLASRGAGLQLYVAAMTGYSAAVFALGWWLAGELTGGRP